MNLPIRYAYFPKPLHDAAGELVPNKKSIASWLCASPRLLGWRLDIHWLWSSSGHFFGLDLIGSLIIVRIGIDGVTVPNPFEKFAADIKNTAMNRSWAEGALRAKLLERSYGTSIDCCGHDYRRLDRYLKLRERSGNPFPVFFGLIASSRSDFHLSPQARKNLAFIQKHVGEERAGLRVISASIGSRQMRVQCRTPDGTQTA
jgi:hypothetical protein